MQRQFWFGTLCVALAALAGCAGLQQMGEDIKHNWEVSVMPTNQEAADTQLALLRDQIAKNQANVSQLETLRATFKLIDNDATRKQIDLLNADTVKRQAKVQQIEAVKPTLPEKPTAPAETPTAAPAG